MKDFLLAVTVVLGIMLIGLFVYPSPDSAHADSFSDKESYESDVELCARAANGTKVLNGTAAQLVSYCLAHG